jgi:hypothetical protein
MALKILDSWQGRLGGIRCEPVTLEELFEYIGPVVEEKLAMDERRRYLNGNNQKGHQDSKVMETTST